MGKLEKRREDLERVLNERKNSEDLIIIKNAYYGSEDFRGLNLKNIQYKSCDFQGVNIEGERLEKVWECELWE